MQLRSALGAAQQEAAERGAAEARLREDASKLTSALAAAQDAHARELRGARDAADAAAAAAADAARAEGVAAGAQEARAGLEPQIAEAEVRAVMFIFG